MEGIEFEITVKANDVIKKKVKDDGKAGVIYIPREYSGKEVLVIIKE